MNLKVFPERLKALIEQCGLSQKEFAKKIGVSERAITFWIGKGVKPRMKHLRKIVEVTGCTLGYLLGDEDPQNSQEIRESGRDTIIIANIKGKRTSFRSFSKKMLGKFSKDRLKQAIIELYNDNLSECARDAKLKKSTVQSWADGKSTPSAKHLEQLLRATKKPREFFYIPTPQEFEEQSKDVARALAELDDGVVAHRDVAAKKPDKGRDYKQPEILEVDSRDSDHADSWYHDALNEIFESGEESTIAAIKNNIREFRQKVRDTKELKKVKEKYKKEKLSTPSCDKAMGGQ